MLKTLIALVAATTVAGCSEVAQPGETADPIVADWEGAEAIGNSRNTLRVDDDMSGSATIYYFSGDDGILYFSDFRVEGAIDGDNRYSMTMECKGGCASLDFEMRCKMNTGNDELDCEGDGLWSGYAFEWKLD